MAESNETKEPKRLKYVVRPGFTHGFREQYKPGDVVELSDEEYVGLEDKLVLVTNANAVESATGEPNTPVSDLKITDGERKVLSDAGFVTDAHILGLTDEQILAIDGIGPVALKKIRAGA